MIEYRYNLIEDLKMAVKTLSRYFWLRKHKIIFYMPTLKRFKEIRKNLPQPLQIETDENIICYWTSSGTWGAYKLPNKIFICPWENKNIASVIKHEIVHLGHEEEVKLLSYEDKEKAIKEKEFKK